MAEEDVLRQFLEWARKLSNRELRLALDFLREELKTRLKQEASLAALSLRPGDWVEMIKEARGKLSAGARGQVKAIRRDKIDVDFPGGKCFTMPASLVRKVDGPPPKPTP